METKLLKSSNKPDDRIAIWSEFIEITEKYSCLSLGAGSPSMNPP